MSDYKEFLKKEVKCPNCCEQIIPRFIESKDIVKNSQDLIYVFACPKCHILFYRDRG